MPGATKTNNQVYRGLSHRRAEDIEPGSQEADPPTKDEGPRATKTSWKKKKPPVAKKPQVASQRESKLETITPNSLEKSTSVSSMGGNPRTSRMNQKGLEEVTTGSKETPPVRKGNLMESLMWKDRHWELRQEWKTLLEKRIRHCRLSECHCGHNQGTAYQGLGVRKYHPRWHHHGVHHPTRRGGGG